MPTKRKVRTPRKTRIVAPEIEEMTPSIKETSPVVASPLNKTTGKIFTRKFVFLLIIVVLLAALAYRYKSLFVVAVVNGHPITRFALDDTLTKQYGSQTLDNMISEEIINQEIAKNHIQVSSSQIDQKVAEITSGLPEGVTLSQALDYQGMTETDFRNQVKMQIAIDQILGPQINVSDNEVEQYIATNSAQFKSASPSAAQASARNILERQKESDAFNTWFSQIRQQANVLNFL